MEIFYFTVRTDTSETGLSRRDLESVPVSSELSFPFFDVSEVLSHKWNSMGMGFDHLEGS